ncbi:Rho GTPase-activating protein [Conoideocrella luteorostrata]|uniref:Rho GTPase-activating protein n=1 Tax=Conoideocrella luteorostrata TaxID=1105319 RepID=A0AAJ0CX18_9HYPO|nr:Rho GTPase-activating protein [Conoideocrella luteorostrata]
MADLRSSADDDTLPAPQQLHHERTSSLTADDPKPSQLESEAAGAEVGSDGKRSGEAQDNRPSEQGPSATAPVMDEQAKPAVDPTVAKHVSEVMASELGIPTLLNRLKQSVASAKEFALFLKKRSILEDDHAQSLRKLCRLTQDNSRRPEHRQGTFSRSYDEMVFIHDRMAENGSQFAASLHQMHEDLLELVANGERGRKMWKTNGLAAEHKVADLEQVMRKSKAKYDSLAEEYDRARTGEARQGGKVLGAFKAHKSAAQQEEDLHRKVQTADQTYQSHVQTLQNEKAHLEKSARPEAVKALHELISETDSAVTLQMQKFAAFNEKLLLGNGLIVSPFQNQGAEGAGQPRSLRQAVAAIDNEKDTNDYVSSHHSKIQPYTEVKYERNPILSPPVSSVSQPPSQSTHMHQMAGQTSGPLDMPANQPFSTGSRSSTGNFGSMGGTMPPQGSSSGPPQSGLPDPTRPYGQTHGRSFSQGNMLSQPVPPQQQQQFSVRNSTQPASQFRNNTMSSQGPPQLGALSFQGSQSSPQSSTPPPGSQFSGDKDPRSGGPVSGPGYGGAPPPAYAATPRNMPASSKPVFGVSLSRLYERDGLAVPMVVYQCIQAVDMYGLAVEGIYRQSGSLNHINKLKGMFDAESSNPALDFRNPENFYHDVNGVTGLLKQFFRDLPDPLFTLEHHDAFVNAAKHEDDIVRRDSLHAIINALPDPNYATLRATTLHLHRIMDKSHINRMNSHNLAVIFGPTLMGSDPSTAIADAGWQIKVIDTILQNTYQIFDED